MLFYRVLSLDEQREDEVLVGSCVSVWGCDKGEGYELYKVVDGIVQPKFAAGVKSRVRTQLQPVQKYSRGAFYPPCSKVTAVSGQLLRVVDTYDGLAAPKYHQQGTEQNEDAVLKDSRCAEGLPS